MVELMNINEAREKLKHLEISIYHKLKEEGRKEVHRKYSKMAHPSSFVPKNTVKLGDLSRVING
jgi:hypothetical protein